MARGRPAVCPYCGQSDTALKGWRRTKTQGMRRIRLCRSCKRKFTPKNQKLVQDPREATTAEPQSDSVDE